MFAESVLDSQRAAVCLGNLSRQHETNAGAFRFCSEEWHEEIRRARQPGAFIANAYIKLALVFRPLNRNPTPCLQRGIGSIPHHVDQEPLQLRAVSSYDNFGARNNE